MKSIINNKDSEKYIEISQKNFELLFHTIEQNQQLSVESDDNENFNYTTIDLIMSYYGVIDAWQDFKNTMSHDLKIKIRLIYNSDIDYDTKIDTWFEIMSKFFEFIEYSKKYRFFGVRCNPINILYEYGLKIELLSSCYNLRMNFDNMFLKPGIPFIKLLAIFQQPEELVMDILNYLGKKDQVFDSESMEKFSFYKKAAYKFYHEVVIYYEKKYNLIRDDSLIYQVARHKIKNDLILIRMHSIVDNYMIWGSTPSGHEYWKNFNDISYELARILSKNHSSNNMHCNPKNIFSVSIPKKMITSLDVYMNLYKNDYDFLISYNNQNIV